MSKASLLSARNKELEPMKEKSKGRCFVYIVQGDQSQEKLEKQNQRMRDKEHYEKLVLAPKLLISWAMPRHRLNHNLNLIVKGSRSR